MKETRTNVIAVDFHNGSNTHPEQQHSPRLYNMTELAFERDKRNAVVEMTDYFVHKNRQEKAWYLVNGVMNSLRQKVFSIAEARKITEFLAGKFAIRLPAIEHAQALSFSRNPIEVRKKNILPKKPAGGDEIFYDLFLSLQVAVQDNLLNYRDALSLVQETFVHYPMARQWLKR